MERIRQIRIASITPQVTLVRRRTQSVCILVEASLQSGRLTLGVVMFHLRERRPNLHRLSLEL